MLLKHKCQECDSQFKIIYDEEKCDDDPHLCPFCGEYIIEDTDDADRDDDY